ncbi:hypothetical protein GKC56_04990 [Neisseriaceae bacterium PsAf]|nr:hypothetical protein [Neisseriaceae bacterium PsAf]
MLSIHSYFDIGPERTVYYSDSDYKEYNESGEYYYTNTGYSYRSGYFHLFNKDNQYLGVRKIKNIDQVHFTKNELYIITDGHVGDISACLKCLEDKMLKGPLFLQSSYPSREDKKSLKFKRHAMYFLLRNVFNGDSDWQNAWGY